MAQFYRHSGIVPPRGLLQTVFAGLGTAISLGIAYSYALVYIPIVHVHFLGTMFFGACLGYLIKNAARAGRIRNRFVPAAIGSDNPIRPPSRSAPAFNHYLTVMAANSAPET
jgi:hypothetical protein